MVTSTQMNHVVELTKFAPLLLAELTGIWSLLWGGTQLRMFTFNTWLFMTRYKLAHSESVEHVPHSPYCAQD